MKRRDFLFASGAAALSSLSALSTPVMAATSPAPRLKIGFIYPGPVADIGWSFQHDLGRRMLEREFGARIETVFVERVPESPEAERVMRQLIDDGCKMIFATSFGFMNPVIKVAAEYPDVIFEHCSGYKTARNVGIYQTRFYEGAYLLGTIAGRMTKTNTLGYVAPIPIPEVIRNLYAFGQDSDMTRFGPNAHLTGNVLNWGVYYVHKVRQVLEGKWKSEDTNWGMKEGIVQLAPLNPALPKDVVALVEQRRKAIIAGTLQPFAGPINNQAGQVQVAAGKSVPESELWTMKWYVEGIQGKQP